jgi:hypothetical protein
LTAQCVDSTQIKPYYQGCDRKYYHPVCGCGITYFNDCIAVNEFGLKYGSFTDGVCSFFDFSFFPNQLASGTSDKINFFIQFKKPDYNLAYMYIVDVYGAIIYRRTIQTPFNTETFVIEESSSFKTGVFFMVVESNNSYLIKKLVVIKAG